jgi:hypothetical protein
MYTHMIPWHLRDEKHEKSGEGSVTGPNANKERPRAAL